MDMIKIDMEIFERTTPWKACFQMEEFLKINVCRLEDDFNWVGAASICSSRCNDILSLEPNMTERLAWAWLAISINESMASSSADYSFRLICEAMADRTNMIVRFGSQPGDYVCDVDRVLKFYLSIPAVKEILVRSRPKPRTILEIDSNVRVVEENIRALVIAGRLNRVGAVDKLITLIERVKRSNS